MILSLIFILRIFYCNEGCDTIKKLNIFVDESGDLGSKDKSSSLYIISFVYHEDSNNISKETKTLNNKLDKIGYYNMIHMADLISNRNEYKNFNIEQRKAIFNALYQFTRTTKIKFNSIIINKKYTDTKTILNKKIEIEIQKLINEKKNYFKTFNKINLYYDNGQKHIGKVLDKYFSQYNNYNHIIEFNHKNQKLFQVADMLTYLDKYEYKLKNKINFNKMELYFFKDENMRIIFKKLKNKRFH